MFGDHLLVAPVTMPEMDAWEVYLPGEEIWTHLWTEEEFLGPMTVKVEAPLGKTPVFYRPSQWDSLFSEIQNTFNF